MAADGTWPSQPGSTDELRSVLAGLEWRLTAPEAPPLSGPALAELARAVEALGRRLQRSEALAAERFAALSARIAELAETERRSQAQLQSVLDELARRREPGKAAPGLLRATLAAASGAATLSVAAAALLVALQPELLPPQLAAPLEAMRPVPLRPSLAPPPAAAAAPRAPGPVRPAAPGPRASQDRYADIAAALERGDALALPRLTRLAEAGDATAQLHLARLHETGAPGVPRDAEAARAWTRRAAEGGERAAMHNLALFLARGEGGPRDPAEAARWFRRAAGAGVIDSQHNLGLLYESGRGVERNLREAYRWFSIAASAGDLASREKAVELERRLKPAERAALDREAAAFRPGAEAAVEVTIVPPATTLAETQALLSRAGYYIGPTDGSPSPALAAAAAAYLRDHPPSS